MDSVPPTRRGTRYRFASEGVVFEVDAGCGGRIVEYSLGGVNVLFDNGDDGQRGSTFWTSPQAAWSWPPPPELDQRPYAARADDRRVALASLPCALGVSVEKVFGMSRDGSVTVDYRIKNESTREGDFAPWEVTRVNRGGVSFFPRGGSILSNPWFPAPTFVESGGIVWIDHANAAVADRKLHANGPGGWIAHADQGLLFVKTFDDVSPEAQAPGEALVEIFVSGGAPYVELEEQGAYAHLRPRDSIAWRVVWRLASADVRAAAKSGALVECLRSVLGAGGG